MFQRAFILVSLTTEDILVMLGHYCESQNLHESGSQGLQMTAGKDIQLSGRATVYVLIVSERNRPRSEKKKIQQSI